MPESPTAPDLITDRLTEIATLPPTRRAEAISAALDEGVRLLLAHGEVSTVGYRVLGQAVQLRGVAHRMALFGKSYRFMAAWRGMTTDVDYDRLSAKEAARLRLAVVLATEMNASSGDVSS